MDTKLMKFVAAVAAIFLLTGFGAGAPIYNVTGFAIPPSPAATMENIEKAVLRAGLTLGWQMTPKGPGAVEGVLVLRKHRAVVDITYDVRAFNITYKDSVNLDYRESDRTIHSNYNGWIQRLEKSIRAQTVML